MGCEPHWIASSKISWLTKGPEETAYSSVKDLENEVAGDAAEIVVDSDPSDGLTVAEEGYSFTLVKDGNNAYHWKDREGNDASWSSFYSAFAPTAAAFVLSRNSPLGIVYLETEMGVESFEVIDTSL